jgi:hypothetical protein
MRVDQSRHQQLFAVAQDTSIAVSAAEGAPLANGGDPGAGDQHRGLAENAGIPGGRVRNHVLSTHQQVHTLTSASALGCSPGKRPRSSGNRGDKTLTLSSG